MEPQQEFYYKVVNQLPSGRLVSAIYGEVDYTEKDVWIYPHSIDNPFLFIFPSLYYAKGFLRNYGESRSYLILKVKANNVRDIEADIDGFYFDSKTFPYGTLFCDSLMVIEEVK